MNPNQELLKAMAEALEHLASAIRNIASYENPAQPSEPAPEPEKKHENPVLSIRKKFAEAALDGKGRQLQKILADHGTKRLKDLKPEHYESVLKEVEALYE